MNGGSRQLELYRALQLNSYSLGAGTSPVCARFRYDNPIGLRRQLIAPACFRRRNIQNLASKKALPRKQPVSIEQIPVGLAIGTPLS
jgi:hypothetical protein